MAKVQKRVVVFEFCVKDRNEKPFAFFLQKLAVDSLTLPVPFGRDTPKIKTHLWIGVFVN